MIDIKSMSFEELKLLAEDVKLEIKRREDLRFKELASAVVDAIKTLKKEFPFAQCYVEAHPDDGYETIEVNILDLVNNISASEFFR